MGQQQLLLVVLGIVVVGIAVVVGVNAFSENSVKTNSDALLQDALRIATEAQVWKTRPELLQGSPDLTKSDDNDFSDVTFFKLGLASAHVVDNDCYRNQNGEFAIFPDQNGLGILASSVTNQNMVGLIVTGSGGDKVDLYLADWNPVRGGAAPDGSSVTVLSHQRCRGRGQTPIQASAH